jgi:predicted CXXCH cytochrome family protein
LLRQWILRLQYLVTYKGCKIRTGLKQGFFLIFLLTTLTVVLLPAFAFEDPHGGTYLPDTDLCAECHRSHTAIARYLTISYYNKDKCFTCHDGTGSIYRTADEFQKPYRHSLAGVDITSTKQCANCHETHKVEDTTSALLVNPFDVRDLWSIVTTLTASEYDSTSSPSGLYVWCEQCHQESSSTPVGSLIIDSAWGGNSYVPYGVHIVWKTSKETVDDSGTTTGYWEYFSSSLYNETSATIGDTHGRAESTSTAIVWNGPYYAGYPAMPCTDCHENHGSNQPWMIVEAITINSTTTTGYDMTTADGQLVFCTACHSRGNDPGGLPGQKCTDCHRHSKNF